MSAEKDARAGSSPPLADRDSPRERVVRDVIRGLYEGRYEPGQRITEAQMTANYGISRGPVREALNRLAATGVIELTPQRGAQVRVLTIDEAIDILVVVQGLVRIAARLAAERLDRPGAAERLRSALAELIAFESSSDTAAYAMARDTFYAALTSMADNAELSRILPGVQIHLIRVQFRSVMRSVDRRRHADYHEIVKAVLAGRPGAAEAAVRTHIGRSISALEQYKLAQKD